MYEARKRNTVYTCEAVTLPCIARILFVQIVRGKCIRYRRPYVDGSTTAASAQRRNTFNSTTHYCCCRAVAAARGRPVGILRTRRFQQQLPPPSTMYHHHPNTILSHRIKSLACHNVRVSLAKRAVAQATARDRDWYTLI